MNAKRLPNGNIQIESFTTAGKFYQVNLGEPRCNCWAFLKGNKNCKHIQAAFEFGQRESALVNTMRRATEEPTTEEMNASAALDAQIAAAYRAAVETFNRAHPPKLICLQCLGVIGGNCKCSELVKPVMPIQSKRLVVQLNLAKKPFALTDAGQAWLLNQLTDANKARLSGGGDVALWNLGTCWYDGDGMTPDATESRELQDKLTRKIRGRVEWQEAV